MADSIWKSIFSNPMGSTKLGTANLFPAVATTVSNLLSLGGNKTQYELYREQARSYLDTAEENAQLIREQGEIALRSLRFKHKIARGKDIATIGAKGGNMSGSNLDVIMQQEKMRKIDEVVLQGNTTNQIAAERINGYRKAANVYGQLAAKASADKWGVLASIFKGVEVYVEGVTKDSKIEAEIAQRENLNDKQHAQQMDFLRQLFARDEYEKRQAGKIEAKQNTVVNSEVTGSTSLSNMADSSTSSGSPVFN